jgi:hypothetical protein
MIGLHTNERGLRLARTWAVITVCVALIVAGVNELALAIAGAVGS